MQAYETPKPTCFSCGLFHTCKVFAKAFFGNKFVAKIMSAKAPDGNTWWFVLGKKDVCQYQNDDIQNPWLVTSCLPEEILKEFFNHTGVQISTMVKVARRKQANLLCWYAQRLDR